MLSIVQSPDPLLNTVCEPCDFNDKSLKRLAKQMAHVMYKNAGCGLAAPQVGILRRAVLVVNDQEEMRYLIGIGADGIMTDYPHLLKEVYDSYGK